MNRFPKSVRLDPELFAILQEMAKEEREENISLAIRRALRGNPIIKARLEARRQAAPAGVNVA